MEEVLTKSSAAPARAVPDPISRDAAIRALEPMLSRLDAIETGASTAFPLYRVAGEASWVMSQGGAWTGGYWAGLWWLRAQLGAMPRARAVAAGICARLESKLPLDSVYRAMIFWPGAALGERCFDDGTARHLRGAAAAAIVSTFDPSLRCVPKGADLGGGADGARTIEVDSFSALMQLLDGLPGGDAVARAHAVTLIEACVAPDGACHPAARFDKGRWQAVDVAGDWSRGQAWAMLGLARAARRWGGSFTQTAQKVCDNWLRTRALTCPDRLSRPADLPDESARAIAALALLALATVPGAPAVYRDAGLRLLNTIVTGPHFARGEHPGAAHPGAFGGACYRTGPNGLQLVEAPWASYHLLAALAVAADLLPVDAC